MEKFSPYHVMESRESASHAAAGRAETHSKPCSRCKFRMQCFGRELPEELYRQLDQHLQVRHISRGARAYRTGADFNAIYFIRGGAFKNLVRNAQGHEFIVGFALPGDVMGLDGYADGYYTSYPVALQDSEICELPYSELQALSLDSPTLRNVMQFLIGRALARAQQERILLGRLSAEERLWSFLQALSHQLEASDGRAYSFELPMTREDIADFLGLQMETVSRAFHKLHAAGVLNVHRRHVRLNMQPDS